MKLIIAGSRHFDWKDIYDKIVQECRLESSENFEHLIKAEEIVSGTASGVDEAGEMYAEFYDIKLRKFPADWKTHGKAAGPIRNREMAKYADALLLIWDGKSKGSANMKKEMKELGKSVYEIVVV